jgi:hypothetical protein
MTKLTVEQQFSLRTFEIQVQQMSREQAQEMLVNLYQNMLVQENVYKKIVKEQWGL